MPRRKRATSGSRRAAERAQPDGWRRALITGASAGIGAAFARRLAARGCDLVLVARRDSALERLGAELTAAHGIEVEAIAADLTDADRVRAVERRLEESERPIDLLVNNAGSETEHAPFAIRDRELLAAEVYLNAAALMRLTHAAVRSMVPRGVGAVLSVSAGAAFYPVPGSAAYGASKAFVNSLTEALSEELRGTGVRVAAICPGFTRTEAQARLGLRSEIVPAAFWKEPDEVADAALRGLARGAVISNVGLLDALVAFLGRHLPRRLWLRSVARTQQRLKSA